MIRKLGQKLVAKAATVFGRGSLGLSPDDLFMRGYHTADGSPGVEAAYEASAIAYACISRQAKDAAAGNAAKIQSQGLRRW